MTAPAALRALFFVGLAGVGSLLLRPGEEGARGELRLDAALPATLARALLAPNPPARVRWLGEAPPDGRALWLLSSTPLAPPLTLPVGALPRLSASPPPRPTAGRHASVRLSARATPGGRTWVYWSDALGALDSLLVQADGSGRLRAGLRVSPARSGWHDWRMRVGNDSVAVTAWVREAGPLRVLVAGGTPDWESRFALRALEASGIDVDARFDLGRRSVGGGLPADLFDYDVVLLMGEVELSVAAQARLRGLVEEGGGVVVAPALAAVRGGSTTALRTLLAGWGFPDSLGTGALRQNRSPTWSLPPELGPLPSAPSRIRTVALHFDNGGPAHPSTAVAARGADDEVLVALSQVGRGRVAFTGLSESWRWRMEAGATEAHEAWWRGWVHWAASGLRDPFVVSTTSPTVPTGSRVDVNVERWNESIALPATLDLERPNGDTEALPVDTTRGTASFLANRTGVYRVSWTGGELGIRADSVGSPVGPAERSLGALNSGRPGSAGVPLAGTDRNVGDLGLVAWTGGSPYWPLWMGAALALLLAAEWTLRRVRGGP